MSHALACVAPWMWGTGRGTHDRTAMASASDTRAPRCICTDAKHPTLALRLALPCEGGRPDPATTAPKTQATLSVKIEVHGAACTVIRRHGYLGVSLIEV